MATTPTARIPAPTRGRQEAATLAPTPILDHEHPDVRAAAALARIGTAASGTRGTRGDRAYVQAAHRHLATAVRPVYTVDELRPASAILRRARGSCSQRMACLEALARAGGVGTRVRLLWVDGRFWYPRFRLTRPFIPRRIMLLWPQFALRPPDDPAAAPAWTDLDELFGPLAPPAGPDVGARRPFTNRDEPLFDAVAHTPVDLLGKTKGWGADACAPGHPCASGVDLSRFVLADDGFFDARDDVFARFGSFQHTPRGRAFERVFGGRKST